MEHRAHAQPTRFPTPHSIDPLEESLSPELARFGFTSAEFEAVRQNVEGPIELRDAARAPYERIGGPFGGLRFNGAYLDPDFENDWDGVAPFTANGYPLFR